MRTYEQLGVNPLRFSNASCLSDVVDCGAVVWIPECVKSWRLIPAKSVEKERVKLRRLFFLFRHLVSASCSASSSTHGRHISRFRYVR